MSPATLSFHRGGTGEPLLLIHGIGSRWQIFEPLLAALAEHHDVIAVDLPGFGASPADDSAPTVVALADRLTAFCEELDLSSPHVVGHSLGGAIALELGRRGNAQTVVAFAPTGFWGAPGVMWCMGVLRAMRVIGPRVRPILPAVAKFRIGRVVALGLLYGRAGQLRPQEVVADADTFQGASLLKQACAGLGGYVFTGPGRLARIPVAVVWGSRDLLLPGRWQSAAAAAALPGAHHVKLRGCGHVAFVDNPTACGALILATTLAGDRPEMR